MRQGLHSSLVGQITQLRLDLLSGEYVVVVSEEHGLTRATEATAPGSVSGVRSDSFLASRRGLCLRLAAVIHQEHSAATCFCVSGRGRRDAEASSYVNAVLVLQRHGGVGGRQIRLCRLDEQVG
jgi:hypothetical protein